MSTNFAQTGYAKRLFEKQIPDIIKNLDRIATAIEKQNEIYEEQMKKQECCRPEESVW